MLSMCAISRICSVRSYTLLPLRTTQRQSHAGGLQRHHSQKTSSLTQTRTPTLLSSTGSTSLSRQSILGKSSRVETPCSHDKLSVWDLVSVGMPDTYAELQRTK